jgi:hypothetical protein
VPFQFIAATQKYIQHVRAYMLLVGRADSADGTVAGG